MRRASALTLSTAVLVLTATGASAITAAPPAGNLLANPDAESAPTKAGDVYSAPAAWTAAVPPGTNQGPYDSCYGGGADENDVVDQSVGLAIDGGARFFFAGQNDSATLTQNVSVAAASVAGQTLRIGGYFGGFASQEDNATLTVRYFDGATELGSPLTTPPVTAADRGNETKMLPREITGVVPANTTTLRVILTQTRTNGSDSDGYADSLYVTFDGKAPARATPTGDGTCKVATAPPAPTPTTTTPPPTTPAPTPVPVQPVAPVKPAKPKKLTVASVVTGLPSTKRCVSKRSFRIRLRNPTGTTIKSASVSVNGKVVATRKAARITAPVNLKGLPKGRYTVKVTTKLADGRTVTGTRRYRTCTPKRKR